jgi:hypothetical protein
LNDIASVLLVPGQPESQGVCVGVGRADELLERAAIAGLRGGDELGLF